MVDCSWPDTVDLVAGAAVIHDAVGPFAGGVSLSAAGAGDADCSFQSGVDGIDVDDDLVSYATSVVTSGTTGRRTLSSGNDIRNGCAGSWNPAREAVHAALRAREGSGSVYRSRHELSSREPRGVANPGSGASLHPE